MVHDFFNYFQNSEFKYIILLSLVFIIPQFLLRYSIPLGISAFGMGVFFNYSSQNIFSHDGVINTFALLGIIALFLHAGLDVNLKELKDSLRHILFYLLLKAVIFTGLIIIFIQFLALNFNSAALLSLALLTPSAGLILSTLKSLKLNLNQELWIKKIAISFEIVSLLLLFILSQSGKISYVLISLALIIASIFILPTIFKFFVSIISKHAPGSEFSFTIILGILLGLITKELGAYYFIGAFVVGISAARYKNLSENSINDEFMMSVHLFANFFIPFYFLKAGASLDISAFKSIWAYAYGASFIAFALVIRLGGLVVFRKYMLKENIKESFGVSVALLPNLVFGLVLYELLLSTNTLSKDLLGGLIIYTIVISTIPSKLLKLAS